MRSNPYVSIPAVSDQFAFTDRFCAAEKVQGKWTIFTGDQIGALLGSYALERYRQAGAPIGASAFVLGSPSNALTLFYMTEKLAMCASTVSSKMLRSMAEKEGFRFEETLTGFKCVYIRSLCRCAHLSTRTFCRWIGNELQALGDQGYAPWFAYEEAIGFANGTSIKDKDGVTALALFAEMAATLARIGKPLTVHLDSLYYESVPLVLSARVQSRLTRLTSRYGYHATLNSYFICRDSAKTNRIFSTLRFGNPDTDSSTASPASLNLPTHLGGFRLTSLRDLTVGYDSSNPPTYEPKLPLDRSAHMISFSLGDTDSGDGVEVVGTVRTSGTEPKVRRFVAPNC